MSIDFSESQSIFFSKGVFFQKEITRLIKEYKILTQNSTENFSVEKFITFWESEAYINFPFVLLDLYKKYEFSNTDSLENIKKLFEDFYECLVSYKIF